MPDYSDIQQELDAFQNATYGEDVRSSMISVTKKIHDIAEQGGGGESVPMTVRQALYTLLSNVAFDDNNTYTTELSVIQAWSTGYSITWSGSHYTKSNNAASVASGSSFTSTITASTGYSITAVTVTMGGVTVAGAYSAGTVTIPSVTGNVVITVTTAHSGTTYTVTNNLTNVANSNNAVSVLQGDPYTATLTVSGSYYDMGAVTVTMGGVDITATAYDNGTISIASVTGNIVITASGVGGLYSLDQDTHTFTTTDATITVSDGNLVTFTRNVETTGSNNNWFCLNPMSIGTASTSDTANGNGNMQDTIFSLTDGDSVRFVLEDLVGSTGFTSKYNVILKKVGNPSSTYVTTGNFTSAGDQDITITASGSYNVGGIVGYTETLKAGSLSYRLKIYVNGTRYI